MSASKLSRVAMAGALAWLAASGCSKDDKMMESAEHPSERDRPAWANKGSGVHPDDKNKLFATGMSPKGMDDEGLARTAAAEDARAKLAAVFDTYVAALVEQYKRYTSQSGKSGKTELDVKAVSRSLTETTLHGSMVDDYWQDAKDGVWYALAIIDLGRMKELAQTADIDKDLKDYIRDNADGAQDDLDARLQNK